MYKKILSALLCVALLVPYLSFNTPKAHALGNVVTISNNSNDNLFPSIVADNSGYLHIAWQEYTGSFSANPGISYSRWNGDTWSAPINISNNTGYADNVTITTDSSRTVHFVWNDDTGSGGLPRIKYRTRTEAGVLSSIETLPIPAGNDVTRNAGIAIDGSGNPNVVYTAIVDTTASLYASTKSAGSWSTPTLVSTNGSGATLTKTQFSQLKSDSSGNLYLVYWDTTQGIFYRKFSAGAWSSAIPIVTGSAEYVRLSVTPLGEAFVTWRSNSDTSIQVRWTISGVWQSAFTISSNAARSSWGFPIMGVTTDSKERAHVGWGERDAGGLLDLKYRSYIAGAWQVVQDVDLDNNDADSPFVYPDLWDNQHFAWAERIQLTPGDEFNPPTYRWEVNYRVAEGTVQTVPTTGGTITSNPFGTTQATLTVPNGALSVATQIGIQVGPVPENVNPAVVTIPKAYTFRPHGLTFSSNATARIFYTAAEVGGGDEALLQPWVWDSQTSSWSAQAVSKRSTAQNWMEASLNHFSLYGISAPIVVTTWHNPKIKGKKIAYSFDLKYADGNSILPITSPEDLKVIVKDSNGTEVITEKFEKNGIQKKGKDRYSGDVALNNLTPGAYMVELYLRSNLIDTQTVSY